MQSKPTRRNSYTIHSSPEPSTASIPLFTPHDQQTLCAVHPGCKCTVTQMWHMGFGIGPTTRKHVTVLPAQPTPSLVPGNVTNLSSGTLPPGRSSTSAGTFLDLCCRGDQVVLDDPCGPRCTGSFHREDPWPALHNAPNSMLPKRNEKKRDAQTRKYPTIRPDSNETSRRSVQGSFSSGHAIGVVLTRLKRKHTL